MTAGKYVFSLQFNKSSLKELANKYPVDYDTEMETIIAPGARNRGYFLKTEFVKLCRWKTPRSKPLVERNPDDYIESVTHTALSTPSERLRVEVLTLLDGVSWPTASVVLHFCHTEPYPILDVRALWSLGIDANTVQYDFNFWYEYTQFCRNLARDVGVTMRKLDRALWQFSKENQ